MQQRNQVLEVWGELACFSRPEMKVERFSYPIITPSAARGIYDAIYCKPKEFRWQITKIELLSPPNYIALRRNEVKGRIEMGSVDDFMKGTKSIEPIWADGDSSIYPGGTQGRTQRQTMALKDVRYRLHAYVFPWPGFEDRIQGLENQFRRRASNGKCIYQPCFGCREFPAYFELIEPEAPAVSPVALDMDDLGWMLYDVFDLSRPGTGDDGPAISLFRPAVRQGVMDIPEFSSTSVHKVEGRGR